MISASAVGAILNKTVRSKEKGEWGGEKVWFGTAGCTVSGENKARPVEIKKSEFPSAIFRTGD